MIILNSIQLRICVCVFCIVVLERRKKEMF